MADATNFNFELPKYSEWSPTQFDRRGLGCDDRQDWLVAPCSQTRDSDALDRSNFAVMSERLRQADTCASESEDYSDHEVHRFGHWGPGWFEIVLVRPGSVCHVAALEMAAALADSPVLCEEHFGELEYEEACEVWRTSYDTAERIAYIRRNRDQFDFYDWSDLRACVRGDYFKGCVGELLS